MGRLDNDIVALAGKMTRSEIAKCMNISRATVNRCLAKNSIQTGQPRQYPKAIVETVLDFFKTHTLVETQKQFPSVKVRSIIDRYSHDIKCRKWDFHEDLKALSMLTKYSCRQVSKKLKRNDNAVIRRLQRKYSVMPKHLNGIAYRLVSDIVHDSLGASDVRKGKGTSTRYIVTWDVLYDNLSTENPDIINCVRVLSDFKRWLDDLASRSGKRNKKRNEM